MDTLGEVRAKGAGGYSGYEIGPSAEFDAELTLTGRGTPGGEYLRRFWHPIALERSIGQLPVLLQVFCESLVLFRDGSGRYGLVHRHCPHRLASLEFAMCEETGLRCCYHGWKFDVDGSILDVPGQPAAAAERIKQNLRLGAYPVKAYKGLLFAYLGPIEQQPPFPIYDAYEILRNGNGSIRGAVSLQLAAGARRHPGSDSYDVFAFTHELPAVFDPVR